MDVTAEIFAGILDAYPYEIVFVDRTHTIRWLNRAAKRRYGDRVRVGNSIFGCHNERTRPKIEAFLRRADQGEDEMFEAYNGRTGEREFFDPVRDAAGQVIGYFERHELPWTKDLADEPVGDYWTRRAEVEKR
ncbi:MAG: PAS domain-containing protein [Clostridiales bacterium]|nr:PAS domain-containing protein [Clostridiales bacterium]